MTDTRLVALLKPSEYELLQGDITRDFSEMYELEWYPYMMLKLVEGKVSELWGMKHPFNHCLAHRLL